MLGGAAGIGQKILSGREGYENRPVFDGPRLIIDAVRGEGMCDECHTLYNVMKTASFLTQSPPPHSASPPLSPQPSASFSFDQTAS